MIYDVLENQGNYNFDIRFEKGFRFLMEQPLETLAPGKYPIDGEDIFAIVQNYTTKPVEQAKLESHFKYIDIHYCAKGAERILCGNVTDMDAVLEKNKELDYAFYQGKANVSVTVEKRGFLVAYLNDVHAVSLHPDIESNVRKIVIKIKV